MEIVKSGESGIELNHMFSATQEQLFRALTEPDQIRQWMRPAGMTLVICRVDLRPGGSFTYGFEMAKGRKLEVRGQYTAVNAPSSYSYSESYDFSPLQVGVATQLTPADGETIFRQTLTYRSTRERDDDFPGVEESAHAVYGILDQYLRTR